MKGSFIKQPHDLYIAGDIATEEWLQGIKTFDMFRAELTRPRNYKYHKKYFALLNHCYDLFDPDPIDDKHGHVEKTFDRFRKDIIILAGYYTRTIRINGDVIIEAKSISFGSMNEEEFNVLYNNTINVMLKYVCRNYSKDDLENTINQILSFT